MRLGQMSSLPNLLPIMSARLDAIGVTTPKVRTLNLRSSRGHRWTGDGRIHPDLKRLERAMHTLVALVVLARARAAECSAMPRIVLPVSLGSERQELD